MCQLGWTTQAFEGLAALRRFGDRPGSHVTVSRSVVAVIDKKWSLLHCFAVQWHPPRENITTLKPKHERTSPPT